MRKVDKGYISAWVLLSVFVPMVLLSSLHIHPLPEGSMQPCHECLDHMVHHGHISAVQAKIDCFLCHFNSNIYQAEEHAVQFVQQPAISLASDIIIESLSLGVPTLQSTRAPPAETNL